MNPDINHFTCIYSHDLKGAVGRVEKFELFDGALRNGVEGRTTPAAFNQTDGLGCKHTKKWTNEKWFYY